MDNSLSAGSVNLVLHFAQQKGLDKDELCRQTDIDSQLLKDPDARLPLNKIQALWKLLVDKTGNPYLPLQLGAFVNPSALGLLAYLMMHCPTLGSALAKLCAYQDMACEGVRTWIETDTWCAMKLEVIHRDIIYPAYTIGSEMSMYVHAISYLTGVPFLLREVHFTFRQPSDTTEYQRVFQTQHLNFESAFNGLIFDKNLLQLPILNANPALFDLFDKHAKAYMDKLKNTDRLAYRVRQEILQGLKGEEPKLSGIARNIGMSERSIQMKLKQEGFTFRQLLDEIRKEIAISHLRGSQNSTTDIAYLLGFSEPSVFSRTFKKWTGISPATYRLTQRSTA